jgi:CheY-like chemotaxis protein
MFNKQWNVLVIDDEPDVHAVTKLALKRMNVFNLPIKLWECASKKEGIDFFRNNPEAKTTAVIIVDVVMENDKAGLEFCEYVRKELKNSLARIIVRTGQAGKAPEREVVDGYDITGYLSKSDATQDKIYSTVKCCIKEFYSSFMLSRNGVNLAMLAGGLESRDSFKKALVAMVKGYFHDSNGRVIESQQQNYGMVFGPERDSVGIGTFEDRDLLSKTCARLVKLPGEPVGADGVDKVIYDDGTALFALAPRLGGKVPELQALFTPTAWPMPEFAVSAMHTQFLAMRPFWMLAK